MGFRIYLSPPDVSPIERDLLLDAFDSNWIAPLGPQVDAFEVEMADRLNARHAVALSSGTAALHLALLLAGVQPGDRVVTATLTFAATANAIRYVGAEPVFIDAEASSWNLDPDLLAEELADSADRGRLPAAIVTVDLYGQACDYDRILPLAAEYAIPVIEDAAEAVGATCGGQHAGTFGDLGVLSFNGNKIMTTSGGGMLVTDDEEAAEQARFLATQARDPAPHYEHSTVGYNYRLSNLLAAVGRGQLTRLSEMVARRREINRVYRDRLGDLPGVTFQPLDLGEPNCWLTCLTVDPVARGVHRFGNFAWNSTDYRAGMADADVAHTYRALCVIERLLLTTRLSLPNATLHPVTEPSSSFGEPQLINELAKALGFQHGVDPQGWISRQQQARPVVAMVMQDIQAANAQTALDIARRHRDALIDTLALTRDAAGRPLVTLVEGHQDPNDALILSETEAYRGNLLGGPISGEDPGWVARTVATIEAEPQLRLWLALFRDAHAETDMQHRMFRLWSVLEAVARERIGDGNPVRMEDGTKARIRTSVVTTDRDHGKVHELIRSTADEVNSALANHKTIDHYDLFDEVQVWYAYRNAVAHFGAFVEGEPSQTGQWWHQRLTDALTDLRAVLGAPNAPPGDESAFAWTLEEATKLVLTHQIRLADNRGRP